MEIGMHNNGITLSSMSIVHNKIVLQQFIRQRIKNTLIMELKMKFYTIVL
ncbi:Uncharacterised protein [Sphingobacterium multivorum]|nr:Uncharacterised protein [Sphingobacterium multivorum]